MGHALHKTGKVSFFKPFSGDYYIIHLDENYNYALIGTPDRKYLWILSRTPQLGTSTYNQLVNTAKNNGFKTDHMLKIKQDCGN